MTDLKVCIFTNAGTVPLEIAQREGFFAEADLRVEVIGTTSSVAQMVGIVDGAYDIAATAIDNVIAYNAGQGAAPTQAVSDLKVFMGSATYRLPFVVAPHIHTFADLRGTQIAVDALSTGFAFLLRDMLATGGLASDDYELIPTGAPAERWAAVQSSALSGALLNAYLEGQAHAEGCRTLISDPDPWDGYQGNAFCAQPGFLTDGPVEAFVQAVLRGVDYVHDAANAEAVADALIAHLGDMPRGRAERVAAALRGDGSILSRGLPVSLSGTRRVMALRERYMDVMLPFRAEDLFDSRVLMA